MSIIRLYLVGCFNLRPSLGSYCILFSYDAYRLSIHADIPQRISSLASAASAPLMFGGLVSLMLALFAGRVGFRNMRKFHQFRRKRKYKKGS